MLVLAHRKRVSLVISTRHEPSKFYRDGKSLWVYRGFTELVASKARPVEAGTKFAVDIFEIGTENGATDEEIVGALPKNHLFDESAVCAIVAEIIGRQPECPSEKFLNPMNRL
jgi:hypothetical protein